MQCLSPVEAEVLNVVRAAGIEPDRIDDTQLLQAIQSLTSAAGTVSSSVYQVNDNAISTAAQIPTDDTVPQITEGLELFSQTVTPSKVGAVFMIDAVICCSSEEGGTAVAALFEAANSSAICTFSHYYHNSNFYQIVVKFAFVCEDTNAKTFSIRVGNNSALGDILHLNSTNGTVAPPLKSVMEIREVA